MTDGEIVLETYSVLKEEKLSYYLSDKSLSSFDNNKFFGLIGGGNLSPPP